MHTYFVGQSGSVHQRAYIQQTTVSAGLRALLLCRALYVCICSTAHATLNVFIFFIYTSVWLSTHVSKWVFIQMLYSRLNRALEVFQQYIEKRMKFPFFSNARTVSPKHAEWWWSLGHGNNSGCAWCTNGGASSWHCAGWAPDSRPVVGQRKRSRGCRERGVQFQICF